MHRTRACQLAGELTAKEKGLRLHIVLPRDKGSSPLASEEHFPKRGTGQPKTRAVPGNPCPSLFRRGEVEVREMLLYSFWAPVLG